MKNTVLDAILRLRPDLRLHGFGVKTTALANGAIRAALYSADSMAWSYNARRNYRDNHSPEEAPRFARKIESQKVQWNLFKLGET